MYADNGALFAPNLPPPEGPGGDQGLLGRVPKAKGAPGVADEGKFIEILRKQPDGSWKYVLDMYSSNLALRH